MCLFLVASGCSRLPAVTYSGLISEIKADNVRFVEVFRTSATVYLRMPSPRSESQGDELRVERLSEEERAALIKLLAKNNVPFEYPDSDDNDAQGDEE